MYQFLSDMDQNSQTQQQQEELSELGQNDDGIHTEKINGFEMKGLYKDGKRVGSLENLLGGQLWVIQPARFENWKMDGDRTILKK